MVDDAAEVTPKRRGGRPKNTDGPAFPREEVDRLLVHGEFETLDDGETIVTYPTYQKLATRFGVTLSTIADFSKKRNCRTRRKDQQLRVGNRARERLTERHAELVAVSLEQILDGVSRYILEFVKNVKDGDVACNSPADFEKMVRLFHFVSGGPDSRKEVNATLSLESLQARYTETFRAARAAPEVRGVLAESSNDSSPSDGSRIPDEVPRAAPSGTPSPVSAPTTTPPYDNGDEAAIGDAPLRVETHAEPDAPEAS